MKPWYRLAIYAICLPWDLVGFLGVLLIRLFWGTNLRWETPPGGGSAALVCELKPNSWPANTWYRIKRGGSYTRHLPHNVDRYGAWVTWGGTTISPHAIFYGPGKIVPGDWSSLQEHEHVHVKQGEAMLLMSLLLSLPVLAVSVPVAFVVWALGYVCMGVAGWVGALLRGEPAYRGSFHEEAAYAIGELYSRNLLRK